MRSDILEQAKRIRESMDKAAAYLTDEQAAEVLELYRPWEAGEAYAAGDMRRDGDVLYRCVQAHTSQEAWRPALTPALWARISVEEWPEWVQPTGAQDAYAKDAKVSHNGAHWISETDANVWEPGVYGWKEVTE